MGWLRRRRKKKKNGGGGGDADVDDGEDFPNSIYTNSRSTASAAATGSTNLLTQICMYILASFAGDLRFCILEGTGQNSQKVGKFVSLW